ncbi:hypothetical protein VUR80DRAFT_345 [Thermomyces stellatus]
MTAGLDILSPSLSPRATATAAPDRKHTDTFLSGHESHSPPRSTVTPQEPPEIDVRRGRLKRRKPPSRPSSPESAGSATTPDLPKTAKAPRRPGAHEKHERNASTPQASPSPSSPPSGREGKTPADDCAPSPSVDVDLDAASARSVSPDRSDDDSLPDDTSQAPATHSAPVVPAAKRREIDAVISYLPPTGPRIEADPRNTNIEVDERVTIDEGFCDESLESHYQAFMEVTEELRSKRRPYYRVRAAAAQSGSTVVQRSVVQKPIRMRRRQRKGPAVREPPVPASDSPVASSSSAT